VDFALNHPAFAVNALEASEILLARCSDDDLAIRTTLELDHADLLTYVGRPVEAEVAYARATELAKSDQSTNELQEMVADRWGFWNDEIKPLSGTSHERH
jgi:predicted RNA polymerase sigma factor